MWTAVAAVLLAGAAAYLLWEPLAVVLAPLLLAGLIIHLLDPLVTGLARKGVARWVGTAVIYLTLALGGAALIAIFAPLVGAQASSLVEEAPALRERGAQLVNRVGASAGIDVHIGADEDPDVGALRRWVAGPDAVRGPPVPGPGQLGAVTVIVNA